MNNLLEDNELLKELLIKAMVSLREISFHKGDDTITGEWAIEIAYESLKEIEEKLNG